MTIRIIKGQSLVDFIAPKNELIEVRAIKKGFRFEFKDKRLPPWFADLARHLDFAMQDNAPGRLRGRIVSLVDVDKHRH